MRLPFNIPWTLAQTRWGAIIDPIVSLPILQGALINNVNLVSGTNVINPKLDRMMQGWIITDTNNSVPIYRSAPMNSKTLTLTASGTVTINLWVF